jgi:NAD dependent epimerase/dehydratase family enzyme
MEKETVLITGANSFIAQKLITLLKDNYHLKFLTRTPLKPNEYSWNVTDKILDEKALDDVQYIVHLAGSKLNDGTPLTPERKKLVYDSRIGAADLIRDTLKKRNQKIKSFISASAIGYYGFGDTTLEIDENGQKGFVLPLI